MPGQTAVHGYAGGARRRPSRAQATTMSIARIRTRRPAIKEVDGDGVGPWVSAARPHAHDPRARRPDRQQLRLLRTLGDRRRRSTRRPSPGITASAARRSEGSRSAACSRRCRLERLEIVVDVPRECAATCAVQQQAQYGGSTARCGELVITAANGKQSIDAVTVTIGGKAPTVLTASDPLTPTGPGAIQRAIDAALPGRPDHRPAGHLQRDAAHVEAGPAAGRRRCVQHHQREHAAGRQAGPLAPRRSTACSGWRSTARPIAAPGQPLRSDRRGQLRPGKCWTWRSAADRSNPQVDRLPLEGIVGWDTTLNGNLAQLLQEPTLMGAYEGAGITVLAKGVNSHGADRLLRQRRRAGVPDGHDGADGAAIAHVGPATTSNPYPEQLPVQPVEHRRSVDHRQLAGRRRHLRPRLGA